ncbi:hypothetical protein Holit_02621 [Hollandina sp. SP2]
MRRFLSAKRTRLIVNMITAIRAITGVDSCVAQRLFRKKSWRQSSWQIAIDEKSTVKAISWLVDLLDVTGGAG